jgi:hypothetical protein
MASQGVHNTVECVNECRAIFRANTIRAGHSTGFNGTAAFISQQSSPRLIANAIRGPIQNSNAAINIGSDNADGHVALEQNIIDAGLGSSAAGIMLFSGSLTAERNTVYGGQTTSTQSGMAIYFSGAENIVVRNNILIGGVSAGGDSATVRIDSNDAVFSNNTIIGGIAPGTPGSPVGSKVLHLDSGSTGLRVTNNLLVGDGYEERVLIYEEMGQPGSVENNALWHLVNSGVRHTYRAADTGQPCYSPCSALEFHPM